MGNRAFDDIGQTIGELIKPEPPRSIGEAVAKAKEFYPLLKIGPKRSRKPGICQQVVHTGDQIDLTTLPILRCWPLDGDPESVGYPAGINDDVPGLGHPESMMKHGTPSTAGGSSPSRGSIRFMPTIEMSSNQSRTTSVCTVFSCSAKIGSRCIGICTMTGRLIGVHGKSLVSPCPLRSRWVDRLFCHTARPARSPRGSLSC